MPRYHLKNLGGYVCYPYRSQFRTGENVHNILLQDVCRHAISGHAVIAASPTTHQLVANAPAPADERKPVRGLS